MALHIDPETEQKFSGFYAFAREEIEPDEHTLVLAGVTDEQAQEAVYALSVDARAALHTVMIKDCPTLTTLAYLKGLPAVRIGVWRCPQVRALWHVSNTTEALVLVDCKRLSDIGGLANAAALRHLYIQGRVWNTPVVTDIAPLATLRGLVTCDLAMRKVRACSSGPIDFKAAYPALQALTITPALSKYYKRCKE